MIISSVNVFSSPNLLAKNRKVTAYAGVVKLPCKGQMNVPVLYVFPTDRQMLGVELPYVAHMLSKPVPQVRNSYGGFQQLFVS